MASQARGGRADLISEGLPGQQGANGKWEASEVDVYAGQPAPRACAAFQLLGRSLAVAPGGLQALCALHGSTELRQECRPMHARSNQQYGAAYS